MFDLKAKLKKTRDSLVSPLQKVLQKREALSPDDEDAIEELLLGSDVGVDACERIMGMLREQRDAGAEGHREHLRREFIELLSEAGSAAGTGAGAAPKPRAQLVIGINGVGKTTSIAKLCRYHQKAGRTVILAAADTFRAAASDQLKKWAERVDVDVVSHREGGDPAAVAYDACSAAKARDVDCVIIDTAGRLHTRVNLMEELKKIGRTCEKVLGPGAVETLLVLDATLGQNSLHQAKAFTDNLDVQGIILTKIDSTAKGGIVIAIRQTLGIPVKYIGAGETLDDFAEFSAVEFVDALLA